MVHVLATRLQPVPESLDNFIHMAITEQVHAGRLQG